MKAYFLQFFGYDYYTNEIMIDTIEAGGSPDKALQIMSHLLGAQQVWLMRATKDPDTPGGAIWPLWTIAELRTINQQNNKAWIVFLESQNEALDYSFSYTTSKGETFDNQLIDVITQVTNHGTHHRAQIGQLLKDGGMEKLPPTDYIFYLRSKSN